MKKIISCILIAALMCTAAAFAEVPKLNENMFKYAKNALLALADGAYDKLFVKYSIPEFPQRLYPPYEGVTDAQFAAFDRAVRQALPGWFV